MKPLAIALLVSLAALAQPNQLTPQEAADGWILLFDGETMFGWTAEGKAEWRIAGGVLIADKGDYGWLRSNSQFADYVLKCEFRIGEEANSGIFLRSATTGAPHETGYELQIFDEHPKFPTGSLVNHIAVNERPATRRGQWHSYEVELTGNHFLVKVDGKTVLAGRDTKSRVGHIGLQYNKDRKIEFRNIKLKPLGLQPIFNGKDLKGWTKVETPRAKEPPVWSVADGMLHVEKGPGQIETEGTWDDFVLQLDIRTNPRDANHHPNSGVFLRGDPGGFWSGYESQIRNEFSDGDPTKPVDWGTGAIYRFQATRRVVPKDGEFFTKTIVARGRHLAVWINGHPVTDFEDTNPEGKSVRAKEARLAAGTVSLQAHDPTTNLDFKNIRIAALPK